MLRESFRLKTFAHNDSNVLPQKANFRRTNVATKLKLTYVKDNFLDVSPYIPRFIISLTWGSLGQNSIQSLWVLGIKFYLNIF
jgi:hypothetical protein